MRLVLDLHRAQKDWYVISDLSCYVEAVLDALRKRINGEPELFLALDWEENFNTYCGAFEKCFERTQLKTLCFYPPYDEESEQDNKILELLRVWFLGQFEADAVCELDFFKGAEAQVEEILHAQPLPTVSKDELCSALAPLVRGESEEYLAQLAQSIADSCLFCPVRHIFVDTSGNVIQDSVTGIQRVVNGFAVNLKKRFAERSDVEVIPVYSREGVEDFYRAVYKNNKFNINPHENGKSAVQFHDGDIFLMPDLQVGNIVSKEALLKNLVDRGVGVYTFIHDIFPVHYPEMNAEESLTIHFANYLRIASSLSGVFGNSRTTIDTFLCWCADNKLILPPYFKSGFAYLGANIDEASPTKGIPGDAEKILGIMKERITLLMVGSIGPRKNHEPLLDAAELLWSKGENFNLVFVGNYGWSMEPFARRMRQHPEKGKRFFWLTGVSDEYLNLIYDNADGVVYISVDEGYGLPIIEAAQHGKPLLLRDIETFREVAGEYATYYSGNRNPYMLAETLEQWCEDLRNGNAVPSAAIPYYTWAESTEKLLGLMDEKLLEKRK